MGQLTLDRLPPNTRRALPFVAALVLGLLAWQMPVLAELGGDETDEVASPPVALGVPTVPEGPTTTTTVASVSVLPPATPPPTTPAVPAPRFTPQRPAQSTTTTPPPSTTTTAAAATTTPPQRITGPLRITKSTWGQNEYQPAAAATDVPDGVLPVELASYIESRQSYIEVRGTASAVTLRLADAESPPDASDPVVIACEITSPFWNARSPGASFADSPQYDAESCVDGATNDDGSWTFDLSTFGDLHGHPGFALVPVADGSLGTYSVWYQKPGAA